jgi:hypothetical protein
MKRCPEIYCAAGLRRRGSFRKSSPTLENAADSGYSRSWHSGLLATMSGPLARPPRAPEGPPRGGRDGLRRALLLGCFALPLLACEAPRGRIDFSSSSKRITLDESARSSEAKRRESERRIVARRETGQDLRKLLPERPIVVAVGAPVFAVLPVAGAWTHVGWQAARVTSVRSDGLGLATEDGRRFPWVPAAFVAPPGPRPRPGQIVRVAAGRELPFGAVTSVEPKLVTVRSAWLGWIRTVQAAPEDVMTFAGPYSPGAPVVFQQGQVRRLGSLVLLDGKHRWVVGPAGVLHRLPFPDVQSTTLRLDRKSGDEVLVPQPIRLVLATVVKVLSDGLRYEVAPDPTTRAVTTFDQLVTP